MFKRIFFLNHGEQEFESQEQGVSSEQWVFYFNTPLELDRFTTALGKVWRQSYQVTFQIPLESLRHLVATVILLMILQDRWLSLMLRAYSFGCF